MATSGSTDYSRTAAQLISRSLRMAGILAAGESANATDSASALETLNVIVKELMAEGVKLWKVDEATVFLTAGTSAYTLSSSGDHATLTEIKTELAADAASGASTITVDSISGISASDNLGIELDDGTIQWTTVSGSPSGTTVTPAAALTGAASADNHVYAYTTKLIRPNRVRSARRHNDAAIDTPMWLMTRAEYYDTPDKVTQGTMNSVYYEPLLSSGVLHIWPPPDNVKDRVLLTVDLPIEDFDATTNTPDFPQEWYNPLAYILANELNIEYDLLDDRKSQRLANNALEKRAMLKGWDREIASIHFGVDMMGY